MSASPARTTTTPGYEARELSPGVLQVLRWIPTPILIAIAALWFIPTLGMIVASLRDWGNTPSGWWNAMFSLDGWTLDAYRTVLDGSANNSFVDSMVNSFAIAIPATVIPLLIASWAAYAIVWIPFRGRLVVYAAIIALIAVPQQVVLIPLLQMYAGGAHLTVPIIDKTVTVFPDLDLAGTLPAVWLTHIGFAIPFAVLLLVSAMASLPESVVDSARSDGATHSQTFWRIAFPLVRPALASLAILLFLWAWNDFLIALTMIGGNNPENLPATTRFSAVGVLVDGPLVASAVLIHSSVAIAVFFALQRHFVRGLTVGAEGG